MAQKEKRIRIEVGQGLEGALTDAHSKRIIDEVMVPLFKTGHTDSAILLGVLQIVQRTDPDFSLKEGFETQNFKSRDKVKKERSFISRLFSFFVLVLMIFVFIKNPMLFLLLFAGSGRGGRFGGGGGGGWSGGGGGFSGGGASGGW